MTKHPSQNSPSDEIIDILVVVDSSGVENSRLYAELVVVDNRVWRVDLRDFVCGDFCRDGLGGDAIFAG